MHRAQLYHISVNIVKFSLESGKKREAYITEMQRLRDGGDSKLGRQPQGSLTLSDIRLPLKKDFMSRIGGPHGTHFSSRLIIVLFLCNFDGLRERKTGF